MCGIAGIYSYHYAAPEISREELFRIRDHMVRRGPDGKGAWFSDCGRVALGHRRLSIIDLSDRGAQPMVSEDGQIVLSYNGEIYNYRKLRIELEQKGYRFRSDSDTEVLLNMYADMGEAMLPKLRGMFAFAMWDARRDALFLARDGYGIKPLYYADDGWSVRIASQVKALIAGGNVSRTPEPAGQVGFLMFGSVPEPYTMFQEIRALPAGHSIWVDELGPSAPNSWFSLATIFRDAVREVKLDTEREARGPRMRQQLLDSVRHHLVADVPVAAFLSGGVDSGTMVALAAEAGAENLATITLAFEEFAGSECDEASLAGVVAKQYSTIHTTKRVGRDEFEADLPRIFDAMDQPSIDGINTWFVSKATSELGMKVALSGVGGDELFGGYPSFSDIPRYVRTMAIPSRIPFLGDFSRALVSWLPIFSSISPKVSGIVKYGGNYEGAYLLRRGLFLPWELESIIDKEIAIEGLSRLRPLKLIRSHLLPDPDEPFARVAILESSIYMRNQLLRDADWASMAHSLEVRTPLIDSWLLKGIIHHLVSGRSGNRKSDLGNSPRIPLPQAVMARPKSGFLIPVAEWLRAVKTYDIWRRIPLLNRERCHWSRKMAYVAQCYTYG